MTILQLTRLGFSPIVEERMEGSEQSESSPFENRCCAV